MTLDFEKLSATTVACLVESGWFPERRVSTERFIYEREREGIPVFPEAVEFYSSFGDLWIQYPSSSFAGTKYTLKIGDRNEYGVRDAEYCEAYTMALGRTITLLGGYGDPYGTLIMDCDGAVYAADPIQDMLGDELNSELEKWDLLRFGTDAVDALNCLCEDRSPVVWKTSPECRERIICHMQQLNSQRLRDQLMSDAWWKLKEKHGG